MNLFRNAIFSGTRGLKHLQIPKPANPHQIFAAVQAHRLHSSKSIPDRDPDNRVVVRVHTFDIQTDSISEDLLPVGIFGKFGCFIIDPYKKRAEDPQSTLTRLAKEKLRSEIRDMKLNEEIMDSIKTKKFEEIEKNLVDKVAGMMEDDRIVKDLNKIVDADDSSLKFTNFFFISLGWPQVLRDEYSIRAAEVTWRKKTEAIIAEVKARAEAMVRLGTEQKEMDGIVGRVREEAAAINAAAKSQLDQIEEILQLQAR